MSELQTNLDNYRFIVERVIPTAYEPGVTDLDPDLADEITLLLDTRSWLDEFLAGHASDPALTEIQADLRMLDGLLLAKRRVLLELVPHFERIRGRTRVSMVGSQWWWYLDRLSITTGVCRAQR